MTRSQFQSILAILVTVATAVGTSAGAIKPVVGVIVMAIGALAAATGRALAVSTDNHGLTIAAVAVAILSTLGTLTNLLPAEWLPYIGVLVTGLTAFGRSVWGETFPGATELPQ